MEGEGVILKNCEVMGVINLVNVDVGIICKEFVLLVGENLVYGLDSLEVVVCEIVFFFWVLNWLVDFVVLRLIGRVVCIGGFFFCGFFKGCFVVIRCIIRNGVG